MNRIISPVLLPAQPADDSRLRKHAAEFEGLLLTEVLDKLKDSCRLPGEESSDSAGDSYQSLAGAALGKSLASKGGLGLADMLVRSLAGNREGPSGVKELPTAADQPANNDEKTLKLSHHLPMEKL